MKYFVEIGANSYDTLIHLCNEGWRGVIVEPITDVLLRNPVHPECNFENVAITEMGGNIEFYFCPEHDDWSSCIETHHRKIDPNARAEKIIIPSITFDQLMQKYEYPKIDLLKIDTEGYDGRIIKSIDFDKHKIITIQFEHHHLPESELNEVEKLLQTAGFTFISRDDYNIIYQKINVNTN